MSEAITFVNIFEWYRENRQDLAPPICNKCIYSNQLKAFLVGGPNERHDYHIEEGEEIFYQLEGDMCLKVVEKGQKKDIVIREEEIFLLPARIEHSPQRFAGTIGCVVERTRAPFEYDGLRYFVKGTLERLYDRFFHLTDIVKDLPPLIRDYMTSEACATGRPTNDSLVQNCPYQSNSQLELDQPINLKTFIQQNAHLLNQNGSMKLFDDPKKYCTFLAVYAIGEHHFSPVDAETLILIYRGTATISVRDRNDDLGQGCLARISPNFSFDLAILTKDCYSVVARMPTPK